MMRRLIGLYRCCASSQTASQRVARSGIAASLLALLALSLSGCAVGSLGNSGADNRYEAAIVDAAVVTPRNVRTMQPLPEGDVVTVVTWVGASKHYCQAEGACRITVGTTPIWVSLPNENQLICRS